MQTTDNDNTMLDISLNGFCDCFEKLCFNVHIIHPTDKLLLTKDLWQVYKENEFEKNAIFNERIIMKVEASFTSLAPECEQVNKRLACTIYGNRSEVYSATIKYIRTRLWFTQARKTLAAILRYGGKKSKND